MNKNRGLIILAGITMSALLVAGGFVLAQVLKPKVDPVPASVSEQIDFTPLVVPVNDKTVTSTSYKVGTGEDGVRFLNYIIQIDDATVTVVESPEPTQFNDVQDFKEKFLETVIQKTTTVSTASGTIVLGQQAKQQNKQLGVMIERGLFITMNPSKTLDQKQWRTIGDALEVIKPKD
jgi:hypothetical protein